jgi:hypothetical protein
VIENNLTRVRINTIRITQTALERALTAVLSLRSAPTDQATCGAIADILLTICPTGAELEIATHIILRQMWEWTGVEDFRRQIAAVDAKRRVGTASDEDCSTADFSKSKRESKDQKMTNKREPAPRSTNAADLIKLSNLTAAERDILRTGTTDAMGRMERGDEDFWAPDDTA